MGITFQICPPLFNQVEWTRRIQPVLDNLGKPGGCVAVLIETYPEYQNFPDVKIAAFDPEERKIIRQAIERLRKRREAK